MIIFLIIFFSKNVGCKFLLHKRTHYMLLVHVTVETILRGVHLSCFWVNYYCCDHAFSKSWYWCWDCISSDWVIQVQSHLMQRCCGINHPSGGWLGGGKGQTMRIVCSCMKQPPYWNIDRGPSLLFFLPQCQLNFSLLTGVDNFLLIICYCIDIILCAPFQTPSGKAHYYY